MQSLCKVIVAVYGVDGVGIIGTVPGAGRIELLPDTDCQVMNANITKAIPIKALRVVSKMFVPSLEFTFV